MGLQIENYPFSGGQANERWNIIRDVATGAFRITSVLIQKCWDNGGAAVGGPLTQYDCNLGSADNKNFYLDPQGFVTSCGGPQTQMVRTSSSAILLSLGYTASLKHPTYRCNALPPHKQSLPSADLFLPFPALIWDPMPNDSSVQTALSPAEHTPPQAPDVTLTFSGAVITVVIMQAYYRIQTWTPSGTLRCLTQPLNSRRTSFQDCLLDAKASTQTFFIDEGKNRALLQLCWGQLNEMEP